MFARENKMGKTAVFLLCALALYSFDTYAGVRFITDAPRHTVADKRPTSSSAATQSQSKCKKAGYTRTFCHAGYALTDPCPYDGSYYAECCLKKYRYSTDQCYARKMVPSSTSCGGLYACEKAN